MNTNNAKNALSKLWKTMIRHPLGSLTTTTLALFIFVTTTSFENSPTIFDPFILLYAAFMAVMVVVTIIAKTGEDEWTALNAGLLGIFLGVLALFVELSVYAIIGHYEDRQTMLAVARSLLAVSTTWVLAGLFLEWWYENHMTKTRFLDALRHPIRTIRQYRDS